MHTSTVKCVCACVCVCVLPCAKCLSLTYEDAAGAHQSGSAPFISRSSHQKAAPEGSKAKESRACSTSKSVRFSLGAAPTPEDKQAAAAAAVATPTSEANIEAVAPTAAPNHGVDMEALDSRAQECTQLTGEDSARKTRSGKLLGTAGSTDADQSAQAPPVSSPGSLGTQEAVPGNGSIRTTRSGRTFSAQTEPFTGSETASVLSKRTREEDSTAAASVETAGTSSSSPAPGPSLSQAPALPASHDDSICHPWKSSLLGMGLSLPEEDRLSDRGRPPITDHPCHKKKSASMTRRCARALHQS